MVVDRKVAFSRIRSTNARTTLSQIVDNNTWSLSVVSGDSKELCTGETSVEQRILYRIENEGFARRLEARSCLFNA